MLGAELSLKERSAIVSNSHSTRAWQELTSYEPECNELWKEQAGSVSSPCYAMLYTRISKFQDCDANDFVNID